MSVLPARATARLRRVGLASVACAAVLAGVASVAGPADHEAGRAVFVAKQCVRCHPSPGEAAAGPPLDVLRRPQGEMELAGRLWNHVPAMAAMLGEAGLDWPRISVPEMAALMKYLGAERARDPAPDLARGQWTLVRKGCLKCHSLRREGGRVEPDLASQRADYESAAAWAATMWTHTPRMAAMAARQAGGFPRFSGDEMGNLVAYLRQVGNPSPGAPGR